MEFVYNRYWRYTGRGKGEIVCPNPNCHKRGPGLGPDEGRRCACGYWLRRRDDKLFVEEVPQRQAV